jgi:hypothetical protein
MDLRCAKYSKSIADPVLWQNMAIYDLGCEQLVFKQSDGG